MTVLYIAPLLINSPCVFLISELPPKPKLLALRGASAIAPENTLVSFQIANEYNVMGFETDVRISLDGVPFILHDSTFLRTTNIEKVFPSLKDEDASNFNMSQIKQLNAGRWFMEDDPMSTVSEVSEERGVIYRNQSVPTLTELVEFVGATNKTLMFDIRKPPSDHPYKDSIRQRIIWWLVGVGEEAPANFTPVAQRYYYPSDELLSNNVSVLNVMFNALSSDNIHVNIYLVNERWLYSLYWCMGVSSITTDNCQSLSAVNTPIFHLSPRNYLILWITTDILSALLVITAFIVQRILWSGSEYSPERIAINSANVKDNGTNKMSRSSHRQSRRQMKEKLILKDIAADMFDEDSEPPEDDYGIESNYTVQSTDGREMARSFHGTSRYPSTVSGQKTVNSFQRTSRYQSSGDGQEIPQTFQRMSGYQSSADEQERMQSFQRTSSYQSSTNDQERPRSFQRTSSYQSSADEQETPRSIPLSSEYQSRIKADMEISNQVL
uniref:Glycerophosphodiester phosphodiesterase domain-containing protein 5 n=1 Tax=Magallana gigas TaxID=29159 RepID=K1R1V9_MAGGI